MDIEKELKKAVETQKKLENQLSLIKKAVYEQEFEEEERDKYLSKIHRMSVEKVNIKGTHGDLRPEAIKKFFKK